MKMTPEDIRLARRLVDMARAATLATLAREANDPTPFASLVATAADDAGRPLLFLSKLAEHTKNLLACPRCSLLFTDQSLALDDLLASPRLTLIGMMEPVPETEVERARAIYFATHSNAAQWASFTDFAMFRLEIAELRLVVGFGRMGFIDPSEYYAT